VKEHWDVGVSLPAATPVRRGPYLQLTTATGMVVGWRTHATEGSFVRCGLRKHALTSSANAFCFASEHIVPLTRLQPGKSFFHAEGDAFDKAQKDETAADYRKAVFQAYCWNYAFRAKLHGQENVRFAQRGNGGLLSAVGLPQCCGFSFPAFSR
jgi:hypothetical protein